MLITRPLKAPTDPIQDTQLSELTYPLAGSPKLDGFRCVIDGEAKTSSMKLQPNPFVRSELSHLDLQGLDGELIVGSPSDPDIFNKSTGPLRRQHGEPDFTFYVFDNCKYIYQNYAERWCLAPKELYSHPRVEILSQTYLYDPEEVIAYTNDCIARGFEGAMIRSLSGLYKQGRATAKEQNIFKRKFKTDAEATIIGFNEKLINLNPAKIDELGLQKRSSHKSGKFPAGTLGSFILYSPKWKAPFNCRGRINDALAQEIWDNQSNYLGKTVTYKYYQYGSIDAPRQPIFHRFYEEL